MPEPVAEPALNGLRLNLRIVSVVIFNFASYLTIGLPLAVLPGYVHDVMGFSAFWAGLVISLQYFATLLSRPHAGRYADLLLSLIHISEPTRPSHISRMPSSA